MVSTTIKIISKVIKFQKMKIPLRGVWEKIRVKGGIYMGVGGLNLRTRLCFDGYKN